MTTATLSPVLQSIDIRAFYERHGCIVSGKPTNSREGKEWAASCPRCGGRDRFSFWESGRFHCIRGCGWHGSSPYWFLRDENYSHSQACDDLGIDPSALFESDSYSHVATPLPLFLTRDEPPCQKWQDAAHAFCQAAEKCFWSDKGETARTYLHTRRFTDATIKQAHLGLCPDWYKAPLTDWGLSPEQIGKEDDPQIKIPRGIVIPWYVDGAIWKIQLRRPDGQYFEVLGSSECLYNVDSFQPGRAVLLVESEFDALAAQQEASDLVASVATGSTTKALTGRWIAKLLRASHILQAFDDDEAGERGAQAWLHVLPEDLCTRWTPWAHDVNDMLRDEQPLKTWIATGLQIEKSELHKPEPPPQQAPCLTPQDEQRARQILYELHLAGGAVHFQSDGTWQLNTPGAWSDALASAWEQRIEACSDLLRSIASQPLTTPPALVDSLGKIVSEELVARIPSMQTSPCIMCGRFFEYMVDAPESDEYVFRPCEAHLVCICIIELREEGKRIDAWRAQEERKAALRRRFRR